MVQHQKQFGRRKAEKLVKIHRFYRAEEERKPVEVSQTAQIIFLFFSSPSNFVAVGFV